MGELETLFAVLAALYLTECLFWVRRDAVAFTRWGSGAWQLRFPGATLGNHRGACLLAHPLPPLGALGVSQPLPLSLSPEVAFSFTPVALNPAGRATQTMRLIRWADAREVTVEKKTVCVNGEVFLVTGSPALAQHIATLLRSLRALPLEKRAAAIRAALRASLDSAAVTARVTAWSERARPLRWLGNSLFLLLFALGPALIWKVGLRPALWALVVALLAHTISLAVLFLRAHKALFAGTAGDPFTPFLTMLLAPPTAIRAQDQLARPLLDAFHPLAVARALCRPAEFESFARRVWTDLRHPLLPLCPLNDPLALAAVEWTRTASQEAVVEFLRDAKLDPTKLLIVPAREDTANRTYCPRCRTQFLTPGHCADCGGQPLLALP